MKSFNLFREDADASTIRKQKQADFESRAKERAGESGASFHKDKEGHVASAAKRHQLAKQGRLRGTMEVGEEVDISSTRHNDMVSRRQMRDTRRSRRKVEHEFSKSERHEREGMARQRKKTFSDKTNEAYDPEIQGRSQIRKTGEGGRKYASKKKSKPEIRRQKAIGGGKTAPVEYKDRKDIGKDKPRSEREQQPTKERGSKEVAQSYADKVKAERRAAAQARIAAKKGGSHSDGVKKTSGKDATKTANKLLSKKKETKVSPDYKPAKASGMTRSERMSQQRKGEAKLKGIMKDQETPKYKAATGTNPDRKAKTKILGRVSRRMAS